VRVVADIDGIIDLHCINFLFIKSQFIHPRQLKQSIIGTKTIESVSDCCLTPTQLYRYHGENKLILNEMIMMSALF
jgi:hypothetical protein